MKRLSFFLGIFSVGLVAFLVLTGQFGGREETDEFSDSDEIDINPLNQNRMSYRSYDMIRGRLRFLLKGHMDSTSGVVISPENLVRQTTLIDAIIELPVYLDDEQESKDRILLKADRVVTDQDSENARVEGELIAEGAGGTPRLETRDIELLWADGEDVRLKGQSMVRMIWPELELRGNSGFSGSVGSSSGLERLVISPPILMGLTAAGSGPFLEGPADGSEGQVRILCQGPMILGKEGRGALFDGGVKIFEVPQATLLDPAVNVPLQHIAADYLDMDLDPVSRRLLSIRSEARENPITVFVDENTRIEGSKLQWKEGADHIELTGEVVIVHPAGRFNADRARVLTGASRCILDGGIRGTLQGPATGFSEQLGPEGGQKWAIEADLATFDFGDGSLETLRAVSQSGQPVVVREQRQQGAAIRGEALIWNARQRQLEIVSSEQNRATFSEGENLIAADTIAFIDQSARLSFAGDVRANLIQWPEGPTQRASQWLGPNARGEVRAAELSLTWDARQRLESLQASGANEPMTMKIEGEDSLQVRSDQLLWRGQDGLLKLTGTGRQEIVMGDRIQLTAETLELSSIDGQARGKGTVDGLLRGPEGPSESHALSLYCRDLVVQFAEIKAPEDDTEASSNRTLTPPRWGDLSSARAIGTTALPVRIEHDNLRAQGQEFLWNAIKNTFRFQGPEKQRVEVASDQKTPGFIEANVITIERDQSRVVLDGDARSRIYLDSQPGKYGELSQQPMSWTLEAKNIEAQVDFESDPVHLNSVRGAGGISLVQPENSLEFRGEVFLWDVRQQRLSLTSEDGQGLQTFHRGTAPKDEIVAREVVLVRTTEPGEASTERLEALLSSVLSAVIHLEGDRREAPGKVDLRSEELLLVLREDSDDPTVRAHEALAWGAVDLRGGPYRILSEKARILARNRTVELTGSRRQQVQVFRDGVSTLPPSRAVKLIQSNRGYRVESVPSAGGWSLREIESSLGRMGRLDRRPSP
ncbi:hypothetical protein CBD41_07095 [bacterium TMED181]|nr:hypothetical protein [Planctomycetota bacterium]OUW43590.1 MAG: hypothetical protein CBD41_07095 [bacterium TMED181]